MKRDKIVMAVCSLAIASVLGTSQANADVLYQIGDGGIEWGGNVTIDGTTINGAGAGGITITQQQQNGQYDPNAPMALATICTDIKGTLYLGRSYLYHDPQAFGNDTGVNPQWGADNAGKTTANANLASAQHAIQNAASLFFHYQSVLTTGQTSDKAALQLAIWDVLYNTDSLGKVSGTRFSFANYSSAALTEANNWITAVNASPTALGTFNGNIFIPVDTTAYPANNNEPPQELLYMPVPEASTMVAGALLLLPFGASAMRMFRKNKTA